MRQSQNPFDDIERMFGLMSDRFEEASRAWEQGELWQPTGERELALDLVERDDEYVLRVDLPGFEREDVDVSIADDTLTIAADRETELEESGADYVHRERSERSARRSVTLPGPVDADAVDATLERGVLTVTLPRTVDREQRQIEIR
jgi:HSP20 family protein